MGRRRYRVGCCTALELGDDTAQASKFVFVIRVSSRCATPAAAVIELLFCPGVTVATFSVADREEP